VLVHTEEKKAQLRKGSTSREVSGRIDRSPIGSDEGPLWSGVELIGKNEGKSQGVRTRGKSGGVRRLYQPSACVTCNTFALCPLKGKGQCSKRLGKGRALASTRKEFIRPLKSRRTKRPGGVNGTQRCFDERRNQSATTSSEREGKGPSHSRRTCP